MIFFLPRFPKDELFEGESSDLLLEDELNETSSGFDGTSSVVESLDEDDLERESIGTEILNLPLGRKTNNLPVVEIPESDEFDSADDIYDVLDTAVDTGIADTFDSDNTDLRAVLMTWRSTSSLLEQ